MSIRRFKRCLPFVGLLLGVLFLAGPAVLTAKDAAPDAAATKIRLLSDALRARDTGDIDAARRSLQDLLALSPNDGTVKRLLASLDKIPRKKVSVSGGTVAAPAADLQAEADQMARAEEVRLARLVEAAGTAAKQARALARQNQITEALAVVERAQGDLPENNLTKDVVTELGIAKAEIVAAQEKYLASVAVAAANPPEPAVQPVAAASPEPPPASKAPAQAGPASPRGVESDAGHKDALYFLKHIDGEGRDNGADRVRTSNRMISEVDRAWQRPAVFDRPSTVAAATDGASPLDEKLNRIVLPSVNFSGMELSRVVNTLSAVSEEFDRTGTAPKGVNIVLLDPANTNPTVNLTLRNLSLRRVLDFITDAVGYQYEVQADAVVVRPGGEQSALETQFFPVSRATVLRMTGKGTASGAPAGGDPLAGGAAASAPAAGEGEGRAIRNFLQLAGVSFEGVAGSTLAFDGSQLIATQTPRNLERIRNILRRYHEVRQVEIEAKFMEVQQGALEELGVQWNLAKKATQHTGASLSHYATSNRTLADAFNGSVSGTQGAIIRPGADTTNADGSTSTSGDINLPIIDNPPPIPGTNNLGLAANPLATITGILGEFDVNAVVRALSQKSGTELLSAPKLTVLSGNPATITIAQELRYPQSYGQVQSQVGTGSASGGGSAGVAITAGTPQEFTTRNVGVELKVTPTVEEDDYSVSLDLNPKVTEFEGFVEYGGQSVAVSGGTTVTVPSGFFQPIFAVREVTTKVTIWDGATLVMGGLTREDVKKVSDKVPVLGSIPGLGRLFRSQGESTQKRNLLIFVTANLVDPGGSLKKQTIAGVPPGTRYQNPTLVTPAGPADRGR